MTARIEHAETAGGTRTRRPATLTGTRRTYVEYCPLTTSSCEGISRRERDSAASQCRGHEGGSSQGVSGRRRDSAASQRRRHEGGASEADS